MIFGKRASFLGNPVYICIGLENNQAGNIRQRVIREGRQVCNYIQPDITVMCFLCIVHITVIIVYNMISYAATLVFFVACKYKPTHRVRNETAALCGILAVSPANRCNEADLPESSADLKVVIKWFY